MKEARIGNLGAFFLVITALIIDGIQLGLTALGIGVITSPVIAVATAFIYFIWLMVGWNVKYTGRGGAIKLLAAFASVITELIPVIGALPATTAGIVAIIFQNRFTLAREARRPGKTNTVAQHTAHLERLGRIRQGQRERAVAAAEAKAQDPSR